ncbi:MAG: alpha-hydroxy-acid oxidizing protein [Ilumatobacteraceae bacterium]|nr:alpha-hydroxy-acid oxidizing protein [Ilumatobacteraceae bacterium]
MFRNLQSVVRFRKPQFSRTRRRFERAANIDDLRAIAKRRLPGGIFDYIDGGAEDEWSARNNVAAYSRIELRPRILRDVSAIDTSTTLLGQKTSLPFILAPTGFSRIAQSQGELAVARVADKLGLVYCHSTLATRSIEEVSAVSNGQQWFQVYMWRDRAMLRDILQRLRDSGYTALALTVDTAVLGRRERDVRRGFTLPPKIGLDTIVDGILHPSWTWDFIRNEPITFANVATDSRGAGGTAVSLSAYINEQFDPSITWDAVEWLQAEWNGPLFIKGIQCTEDAVIASKIGVAGIMVSNHGGRQLDGSPAPIDLIEPIAQLVQGQLTIICEGGIRRGSDILKAIALGADICAVGRAHFYGLGAAGELGVMRAIEMLKDELTRAMALSGVRKISEITRDLVKIRQ